MGMFDDVNFKMDCPKCGKKVVGFQSKGGPRLLSRIEPDSVNRFYSFCQHCGVWIEFNRPMPMQLRQVPLTKDEIVAMGFVMTVEEKP